jgi:perosamine synthetase
MSDIHIADPDIGDAEIEAVVRVLEDGQLADGPEVRAFEDAFASYVGADHGVAASNGTTALHAALKGLGIGEGHRVLTSPFSFIASANAVRLAGADVGFVDIDPHTYNMDMDALEARLEAGEQVDAVVPVHIFGLPADMPRLMELADEYGFLVLEDAAQAHGATIDDQLVGSFGDAACFSFYPTKNMTTGEGGMVTTSHEDVAEATTRFVNHGRVGTYEHSEVGHNFRMTSMAAAIGQIQLERLPEFVASRQANAARYDERLSGGPVITPEVPDGYTHAYHQYTIRVPDRDGLMAHLDDEGIGTGVYYPKAINKQPAYTDLGIEMPEAERAAAEVLSLPVHPGVSEADVDRVADAILDYFGADAETDSSEADRDVAVADDEVSR